MTNAKYFIEKLDMIKHPEGGYYKESLISNEIINVNNGKKQRRLWTSIYFLLQTGDVSHFHKLESDEMWYYHGGSSLTIYMIDMEGNLITKKLGLNIDKGEDPQVLVPKGFIFGSAMNNEGYALVGCMVSPGFNFEDFKLFSREKLLKLYPEHSDIIFKLTKED
ncbi:cupin domain-containing protein [Clostridium niameyense]|uniref:Cupin domain-containing protein n=1 Tax=Clostridium niameyense TaxID=1622073 RepID=A0A6M0R9G3_9CLOT|nr:cupin domain-containing protein [Clostridium niameyense]NEZ46229.1 cupin domain-containing protein [Clostridium niameyense]